MRSGAGRCGCLSVRLECPHLGSESRVLRVPATRFPWRRATSAAALHREVDKGKVMVLLIGLDNVAEAKARTTRRSTVKSLLQSCLEDGLPFIAAVSDELAPRSATLPSSVSIADRNRRRSGRQFREMLMQRGVAMNASLESAVRGAFDGDEQHADPWFLEVAAEVVLARLRSGQEPSQAIQEVFAPGPALRRELLWMCEYTLGCPLVTWIRTPLQWPEPCLQSAARRTTARSPPPDGGM